MTSYETHPYNPSNESPVIEPGYLPNMAPSQRGPPVEIDDYARIYGPPHIREIGYWGIGVSIVGALFTSSGLCLQKAVHKKIAENPELGPPSRHTLYIAGVAYVGMGLLLKALLYVLLPQSAAAPLSAQTILFSSVLEYLFLGGPMKRITAAALLTMGTGIILATLGANTLDGEYSLVDLFNNFKSVSAIVSTAGAAALVLTIREVARSSSPLYNDSKGLVYLSFSAGIFAGWLGTAIKCLSEVVKYAFLHGMRPSTHDAAQSGLWIFVLALPILSIPKLSTVGYALVQFHPKQFLPCYQAAAIMANAFGGIAYFKDFAPGRVSGTGVSIPLYAVGLALTCLGTLMLAKHVENDKSVVDYDTEESRSLLGWGGSHPEMDKLGSEKGTQGVDGEVSSVSSRRDVFIKGSDGKPFHSYTGSSRAAPSTPGRFVRVSRSAPSPQTPGRSQSGMGGTGFTPRKEGAGTPGRGIRPGTTLPYTPTPSTPGTPRLQGLNVTEALLVAEQIYEQSGLTPGKRGTPTPTRHVRRHSGAQEDYAAMREILSPFENEPRSRQPGSGWSGGRHSTPNPTEAACQPMQALYRGSMQGLDVDGQELKWIGGDV